MKEKTCIVCGIRFLPIRQIQRVCSSNCAIKYAIDKRDKKRAQAERIAQREDRKVIKLKLESFKTRSDWMKEAQRVVNAYRRALLADEPCISCGRYHQGQYHAGHYMSVGAHPELRFEELNIWKQCQPCNTHLSGNLINYRKALIKRIGTEKVEWLEGHHEPKHYAINDLKQIILKYKSMLKEIKKNGL